MVPQKPITLKSKVEIPKALKGSPQKKRGSSGKVPVPVKPSRSGVPQQATPQQKGNNQRELLKLSPETRAIAETSARKEGLDIGEWVEQLILRSAQPSAAASGRELLQILERIEQRLERIENPKGLWKRLWEEAKNQVDGKQLL